MVKLDGAAQFPDAVRALVRAGIPVFVQMGITPQTALQYGVDYATMAKGATQVPEAMSARLVAEAKSLEEAGASMIDFTNSGPVAGPEVAHAVSIPGDRRPGRRPLARRAHAHGPCRDRIRRSLHRVDGRDLRERGAHLARRHTCIVFDRRECGQSGGRVEPIAWGHFAAQGKGLLDHLGIERAYLMGGCMGCAPVAAFAVAHPKATLGMVLWWPVGGPKYRIKAEQRFAEHLAFVAGRGLDAVVDLVAKDGKPFGADPRGGPWASVIRNDAAFALAFARQDPGAYLGIVEDMARGLLGRDTAPGAEPGDLMKLDIPALIVPGHDESHATSAARYLEECLPRSQYWDAAPAAQTEESAAPLLLRFLENAHPQPVNP